MRQPVLTVLVFATGILFGLGALAVAGCGQNGGDSQKLLPTDGAPSAPPQSRPQGNKPDESVRLGIVRAQSERWRKTLASAVSVAQDQRRQAASAIMGLRAEFDDLKQEFGLLQGLERIAAIQLARKMARGQALNDEELAFAKSKRCFDRPLRQLAAASADNKPVPKLGTADPGTDFTAFLKMTGQDGVIAEAMVAERRWNSREDELAKEEALLARLSESVERGDYAGAIAECNRALDTSPGEPMLLFYRGVSFWLSGNRDRGAGDLHAATARDTSLVEPVRSFERG